MKLRCSIGGYDVSDVALVEGATITQDSTQAISTADISLFEYYGESRYDHARYDESDFEYQWDVQEWMEIFLFDQDTNATLFGGFVLTITNALDGPHVRMQIHAADWGILLDRRVITQTWPDGTPDSTIVEDLVRQVPELSAGTIVTQVAQLGAIEVKDQRIRDILDDLCQLTGGEWNVGYDGAVNYYRQGSIVAPFGFSDVPNGTTLQPFQPETIGADFAEGANRITALGAVTGGTELATTVNEISSQHQYGILSVTLVDRSINDQATLDLWAQTQLALRAWPQPTATLSYFTPGLTRGMTVSVEAGKYGVFADMILRSLRIVIMAPDRTRVPVAGHLLKYTAQLGSRPPDLVYALRRMQRRPVDPTISPPATIPPGSITGGDFASGIAPVYIVDRKPAGAEWAQYPADAVFLLTTDRKLYRRIPGNDWTAVVSTSDIEGQLQTHQFAPGSVTTTVLADGSVVTAKIPAGAITAPTIAIGAVTPSAIADGAVITAKIPAGAIAAPQLAASSVTANAIAANAVAAQNLQAGSVTANAIAANSVSAAALQAGSVTANAVSAGAITATALAAGSVTANAIAANAVYSQAIQANAITALQLAANSVVAGKIAALAVLAGNLAADSVIAGTIAVGAVRAGNLAANAVTAGTIAAGVVTAQTIQTGTITSDKFNVIELSVGYGGNKPGRIAVYNTNFSMVALFGDLGGAGLPGGTYYGVWGQLCAFGGTGYNNAPMYTDLSGSLFLRQANLTITAADGSYLQTGPSVFDATYGSIALNVVKPGDSQSSLVSRGLVCRSAGGGSTVAALVRSPFNATAGELTIYNSAGQIAVFGDGANGVVRALSRFDVGGNPGFTGQVPAGSTINVVGGIVTGYVLQ